MGRTRLKVCCIASPAEASLAISAGADALGLVGEMPTGPGVISDEVAREVAVFASPPVASWLLTSEPDGPGILAHARRCAVGTVQIVRHVEPEVHRWLANKAPWLRRVQVIHVEGSEAMGTLEEYRDLPHAYLLDSGRPSRDELGGTGRAHDWDVSAAIVARSSRPVFLAGGLHPDNIAQAVETVRPFGVDVCSGLRTSDRLDTEKLTRFANVLATARPVFGRL
ncbi:MAG: phosphoribosylanthranilate isomerase [Pseudomonadota bacterium]